MLKICPIERQEMGGNIFLKALALPLQSSFPQLHQKLPISDLLMEKQAAMHAFALAQTLVKLLPLRYPDMGLEATLEQPSSPVVRQQNLQDCD